MSASTAQINEYNRFGPWIDEVMGPDEVPSLYRAHPIDFGATRLVLKVPRNITRRNAVAGMDLYDHLLILDDASLTLLSRRVHHSRHAPLAAAERGYDAVAVEIADVVAIKEVVNLLDGRLTVSTSAGTEIAVPFNGSARGKVTLIVDQLRAVTSRGAASAAGSAFTIAAQVAGEPTAHLDRNTVEPFLFSRFQELAEGNSALLALGTHATGRVAPLSAGLTGLWRRATHAASPMKIYGGLVAADAAAIECIGRHEYLVRGKAPVYSSSRLVVPLGGLDFVQVAPHPHYADVTLAFLGAGQWSAQIAVPRGSASENVWIAAARGAGASPLV